MRIYVISITYLMDVILTQSLLGIFLKMREWGIESQSSTFKRKLGLADSTLLYMVSVGGLKGRG
ncbi:MAG: hypothetical protein QXN17_02485 [Nitrososphaerota archaeon]